MRKRSIIVGGLIGASLLLLTFGWQYMNRPSLKALSRITSLDIPAKSH
jgi:hypothetical protein